MFPRSTLEFLARWFFLHIKKTFLTFTFTNQADFHFHNSCRLSLSHSQIRPTFTFTNQADLLEIYKAGGGGEPS